MKKRSLLALSACLLATSTAKAETIYLLGEESLYSYGVSNDEIKSVESSLIAIDSANPGTALFQIPIATDNIAADREASISSAFDIDFVGTDSTELLISSKIPQPAQFVGFAPRYTQKFTKLNIQNGQVTQLGKLDTYYNSDSDSFAPGKIIPLNPFGKFFIENGESVRHLKLSSTTNLVPSSDTTLPLKLDSESGANNLDNPLLPASNYGCYIKENTTATDKNLIALDLNRSAIVRFSNVEPTQTVSMTKLADLGATVTDCDFARSDASGIIYALVRRQGRTKNDLYKLKTTPSYSLEFVGTLLTYSAAGNTLSFHSLTVPAAGTNVLSAQSPVINVASAATPQPTIIPPVLSISTNPARQLKAVKGIRFIEIYGSVVPITNNIKSVEYRTSARGAFLPVGLKKVAAFRLAPQKYEFTVSVAQRKAAVNIEFKATDTADTVSIKKLKVSAP